VQEQVTFSTFYTNLPANVQCLWRFVLADSPEAAAAKRNLQNLVIDCTAKLGVCPSPAADEARQGRRYAPKVSVAPPVPGKPAAESPLELADGDAYELPPSFSGEESVKSAPPASPYRMAGAPAASAPPELAPPPRGPARFGKAQSSRRTSRRENSTDDRSNQINTWGIVMLVVGILMTLGGAGAMLYTFVPNLLTANKTAPELPNSDTNSEPLKKAIPEVDYQLTDASPKTDGETKDGETKDGETKDGETKDGETKDGETKDGETKDGETKDGETKDGETKDGETKDGETKDGETKDGETKDGETKDGETKDGDDDLTFESVPWLKILTPASSESLPTSIEEILSRREVDLGLLATSFGDLAHQVGKMKCFGVRLPASSETSWFTLDTGNKKELKLELPLGNGNFISVNAKERIDAGGNTGVSISIIPKSESLVGLQLADFLIFVGSHNEELFRLPLSPLSPRFKKLQLSNSDPTIQVSKEDVNFKSCSIDVELLKKINSSLLEPFDGLQLKLVEEDGGVRLLVAAATDVLPSVNYPFVVFELKQDDKTKETSLKVHMFVNILRKRQHDLLTLIGSQLSGGTFKIHDVAFESYKGVEAVRFSKRGFNKFAQEIIAEAKRRRIECEEAQKIISRSSLNEDNRSKWRTNSVEEGFPECLSFFGLFHQDELQKKIEDRLSRFVLPIEIHSEENGYLMLVQEEGWDDAQKEKLALLVQRRMFELAQRAIRLNK
jgi:hypothetical protein